MQIEQLLHNWTYAAMTWLQAQLSSNEQQGPEVRRLGLVAAKEITAINGLFAQHGVDAEIDLKSVVASDTGDFIRYKIIGASKVAKIKSLEEDLSVLLSESRDDDIKVKIRTPRLMIELPYPLETRNLEWADAQLGKLRPFQMLLGMDYSNTEVKPAILDYSRDTTANALFSGTTGSGKTSELLNALISMAYATSPAQALYVLIDPKRDRKFSTMAGLPHTMLFNDPLQCVAAVASVRAELRRRQQTATPDKRKIFLVLEEFSSLLNSIGDKATIAQLEQDVLAIAEIGREKGIHIIACTQKATVDLVGSVFKGNLPIKVCGKVNTREESKVGCDLDDVGAELLPECGSYYFVQGGRAALIRGYYMSDEERETTIGAINTIYSSVAPYRIEIVNSDEQTNMAATNIDERNAERILEQYSAADLFDEAGKVRNGMQLAAIKLLFGADAENVGNPRRVTVRALNLIKERQIEGE